MRSLVAIRGLMWTIARGSPRPFLLSRAAPCHLARELDPQTGVQHVCLDIDVGASSIGCMAYRIGYPGVKVRLPFSLGFVARCFPSVEPTLDLELEIFARLRAVGL